MKVRCNQCMAIFEEEEIQESQYPQYMLGQEICPRCFKGGALMDLPTKEDEEMAKKLHAKTRLDYLKQEIENERISQAEILELESLKAHIDPSDTLLLQWAGVEEKYQKQQKCIYCDNMTSDPHFQSDCCGRGMCEDCYNGLQGTEEQIQLDYCDDEEFLDSIKPEYQKATYLCFNCSHIWKKD